MNVNVNKTVRALAVMLGVSCLSVWVCGLPVWAQGNTEEMTPPPLPSSVFPGEEEETERVAPRIEIIGLPEPETAADKRAVPAEENTADKQEAPDNQDALVKDTVINAPNGGSVSEMENRGSLRRAAPRVDPAASSALAGKRAAAPKVDSSKEQPKRKTQTSKRRDPGTHKRSSVRGMQTEPDRIASQPPSPQGKEIADTPPQSPKEPAPERETENVSASAAADDDGHVKADAASEPLRPRGTHPGSKVRGYVAPVRPKTPAAEPVKEAIADVKRQRVAPGQYGEALGNIVAEEMRGR